MSSDLYYTPPSDKVFNDIKDNAIKLWQTYDDTYGYASEKVNAIKDITNVDDNWMYMVAMFDVFNQQKLLRMVNIGTATRIREAMS